MQADKRDRQDKGLILFFWVEEYLFFPKSAFQKALSVLLLPLSALYCLVVVLKRAFSVGESFSVPIVSIGNLTVGGSGKTPFVIALAKEKKDVAIVLRGYKRQSSGTIVVSNKGSIKTDIKKSGDEAMLFAKSLPQASVIVSEDRKKGIKKALEIGAKVVFLDDGFSKANIDKLDILLKPHPQPYNNFCLPSGPYREPKSFYKKADIVAEEDKDFKRVVSIVNKTEKMLLVTAISKPQRLEKYLPKAVVGKVYYKDHYSFEKKELIELLKKYKATSILTTEKDAVKMENFGVNLTILKLNLEISPKIVQKIDAFLDNFDKIR